MQLIKKWTIRFAVFALALGIAAAQAKKPAKSDAEIKQEIIKQSIASYRGNCLCPYNVDRAGEVADEVAHTADRVVPLRLATKRT